MRPRLLASKLAAKILPGWVVAGLMYLLATVFASYQLDSGSVAELRYLGLLATLVLAAVALFSLEPAWELGLGALLSALVLAAVPAGTARAALLGVLLVLAFTVATWRRLVVLPQAPPDGLMAGVGASWGVSHLSWTVPLAFGAQVLLRGRELVGSGPLRLVVLFLVFPLLAALAAAFAARRVGARITALLMVLVLLPAPGWTRYTVLAAVILSLLLAWAPRRLSWGGLLTVAAALVAVLFAATAALAAYPWGRETPLQEVFRLPRALMRRSVETIVPKEPGRFTVEAPNRRVELSGEPISEVVLDTQLAHAAGLTAGIAVARLTLIDGDGNRLASSLELGRDTGEWAAERPDVAAMGNTAPPPFRIELVANGSHFARTYRARWRLPQPLPARALLIERDARLPDETELIVFRAELLR